ncbi:ABC transporter permease [Aquamicrobium sp. LC103]|uniref:ABC transporter permease n=1 Tax=Aquamicrobium sp. LC103 TaxID=1120658 RepID=UPI00063EBBCC|nr:ABC transporter permease [Aquamicrobium sp. LC103]TKT80431.1 ABC transporter permease [Aquamicrobium sp. LC103]
MNFVATAFQRTLLYLIVILIMLLYPLLEPPYLSGPRWLSVLMLPLLAYIILVLVQRYRRNALPPLEIGVGLFLLAFVPICLASLRGFAGEEAPRNYWTTVAACVLAAWLLNDLLSGAKYRSGWWGNIAKFAVPTIFSLTLLFLWEVLVRALAIPFVLLPPPTAIAQRLANSLPVLMADVNQTIFRSVLIGYALGCAAGFAAAIVADRFVFLRRGLLPIGNMVSALPIIGVAPIMVMWFGFDWQSKAAVVVIMTFFPMLVNTVAGLAASGHMERDLMRTYASGYWQTLVKLRLPAAMPFIFNALKINSTLALIGAIVAEFFGTPVVGMGFRISTEVGRMNVDMVWAEIAVAALAGSVFYGVIALVERAVTFWHPSIRGG